MQYSIEVGQCQIFNDIAIGYGAADQDVAVIQLDGQK